MSQTADALSKTEILDSSW